MTDGFTHRASAFAYSIIPLMTYGEKRACHGGRLQGRVLSDSLLIIDGAAICIFDVGYCIKFACIMAIWGHQYQNLLDKRSKNSEKQDK